MEENNLKYCPECGTHIQKKIEKLKRICPSCGFVNYTNPVPVVSVIVLAKNNVVIVRSKEWAKGMWGLPGGYTEWGESLEETAKREIKEETNLDIHIKEFVGSYPIIRPEKAIIFIVFLGKALTEEIRRGGDVVEIAVLPPKKALEQITGRIAKKAVADWLKETL